MAAYGQGKWNMLSYTYDPDIKPLSCVKGALYGFLAAEIFCGLPSVAVPYRTRLFLFWR